MWGLIKLLFGVCPHLKRPLLRRGPDGRMGLECPDCFDWTPIEVEPSHAARTMAAREEVEKWARSSKPGFKVA